MKLKKHTDFIKEDNSATPVVKKGDRIELITMGEDVNPIEPGVQGTVDYVDDLGQIHVNWDNGRSLAIIPEEDTFKIIKIKIKDVFNIEENQIKSLEGAPDKI